MMLGVCLAILLEAEPTYAELSRSHGLGPADRLLRDGKYLEAAVAYRNQLLEPGDREGVRIPLALALLAKGDALYAGIEIRRAHMLYPAFLRLVIHPEELFGAKGVLAKAAQVALQKEGEGDGGEVNAVAAYAFWIEGDRERGLASIEKYITSRGTDDYAKDLKAALQKLAAAPGAAAAPAEAPAPKLLVPAVLPLRVGEPLRVGVRFIEPEAVPRGDIFSR